jgi:hypothetical protein
MKIHRYLAFLGLAAGIGLLGAGRGSSEEPKTEADKKAKARGDVVAQLALAHELMTRGQKAKSPLDLLTAAEILRQLNKTTKIIEAKDKPEVEGKGGVAEEVPPLTLEQESELLLKEARDLAARQARDNKISAAGAAAIDALAREVERIKPSDEGKRAAVDGPQRRNGFLHPGQSHTYRIDFGGGAIARVFVSSEGRSPLRVTVRNTDNAVRGEDEGWNPSASWWPERRGGGVFIIRVQNVGDFGTSYRLVTN